MKIKQRINNAMRYVLGERRWVALKSRGRPMISSLRKIIPGMKNGGNAMAQTRDFERGMYARMAILDAKTNFLLYGAPTKDNFTLQALQSRDFDGESIALDFFMARELAERDSRRALYTQQFAQAVKGVITKNRENMQSVLSLSALHTPELTRLKKILPHMNSVTTISREGVFPDAEARHVPTDPLTALNVLSEQAFDLIFSINVIETLTPREQVEVIVKAIRILNVGGVFYLQLPNLASPQILYDRFWGNPDCLRPYSISLIKAILETQPNLKITLAYSDKKGQVRSSSSKTQSHAVDLIYVVRKI